MELLGNKPRVLDESTMTCWIVLESPQAAMKTLTPPPLWPGWQKLCHYWPLKIKKIIIIIQFQLVLNKYPENLIKMLPKTKFNAQNFQLPEIKKKKEKKLIETVKSKFENYYWNSFPLFFFYYYVLLYKLI